MLGRHHVGGDLKGLDVCNNLERDKGVVAAWMEGKLLAMTVLTVLPSFCAHCGTWAMMSKGQYSFQAQCSLPFLTTRTAASAHQADQSLQDQSSANIMAPNHLWGDWAKLCRHAPPNFWPDLSACPAQAVSACPAQFLARFRLT